MQACKSLLLLGLAGLAMAATIPDQSDYSWERFKEIHGKSYDTNEEEIYRKLIFEEKVAEIKEHNRLFMSGLETYSMAVNHLTDKLPSEIFGNGLLLDEIEATEEYVSGTDPIADEKDWRDVEGAVTAPKNQGGCGSCWAFSTTGSLEGQWMLKKNQSVSLSESQLVDCDHNDSGCNGGLMSRAFAYIKQHGIESEADYPYVAKVKSCQYDKSKVVATVTGYKAIKRGSEKDLTSSIANVGPISVAIYANGKFSQYKKGVFYDKSCGPHLNHGVLAVGYGHDKKTGLDFYIVKNSWGGRWGESGYIRMARNKKNMCGIATMAGYPTV